MSLPGSTPITHADGRVTARPVARRLRIVHIASGDLWAGAEAMLLSLAEAQSRIAGVDVAAIVLNEGQLAEELRSTIGEVTVLSESELSSLRIVRGLVARLRQLQPDIVHTHRVKEDILGGLACRIARIGRCVRTVHGIDEGAGRRARVRGAVLSLVHRACIRALFDRTFVVSMTLLDEMATRLGREHVKFVANGIDAGRLRAKARPRAPGEGQKPIRLGIVGRLAPVKRVDLFIDMVRLLREESAGSFDAVIYGEGPERASLQRQVDRLGLQDSVSFAGFHSDIVPELAGLDLLFVTSDSEGLPMVVLEAMALNIPIISHAVGQIPAVLEDGKCGVLVTEHRAYGYAREALRFLRYPEEFVERARRAADRVAHSYSSDACAHTYLDEYASVMQERQKLAS